MGNQMPYPGVGGNDFTEPLSRSTEVTYDGVCSCFGSGSISLSVEIDKDTYEIGEEIVINAQVNNQSNKRVRAIRVFLQRIFENKHDHYYKVITSVGRIANRNIQPTGSFSWNNHLEVPVTTVSMDNPIGKLSYVLEVIVVVAFARNFHVQLPVKIIQGTKSVEMIQSYAAGILGPMMQTFTTNLPPEMTQPYTTPALGPEMTQANTANDLEFKKL